VELKTESNFDKNFDFAETSSMLETNSEFIDFQNGFDDQMPLPGGFQVMDQSLIMENDNFDLHPRENFSKQKFSKMEK
jgi:hypothetical protein